MNGRRCGHSRSKSSDPFSEVCARPLGHEGPHVDHVSRVSWGDMDADPVKCRAFYSPDPDTQFRCGRGYQHTGYHFDEPQNTMWVSGWSPEKEGVKILDGRSEAHQEVSREKDADPANVTFSMLVHRVENLEQTAASGAATDNIVAGLRAALGEIERRMTRLEGRGVPHSSDRPSTLLHEVSATQWRTAVGDMVEASHHAGVILGDRIKAMQVAQETATAETRDRLSAMSDVLGAMAPVMDRLNGHLDQLENEDVGEPRCQFVLNETYGQCELPVQHEGRHQADICTAPNSCGQPGQTGQGEPVACTDMAGHGGAHQCAGFLWSTPDPDTHVDQVMDAGGHLEDGQDYPPFES